MVDLLISLTHACINTCSPLSWAIDKRWASTVSRTIALSRAIPMRELGYGNELGDFKKSSEATDLS